LGKQDGNQRGARAGSGYRAVIVEGEFMSGTTMDPCDPATPSFWIPQITRTRRDKPC
jgi:hypothetical protein